MKPLASLSLDLDNLWAYQMTHGDPGWDTFPTYLPEVVPKAIDVVGEGVGRPITFFVVGQDAALSVNRGALEALVAAGHELGNHSFRHQPWLHRYSPEEIDAELRRTEEALSDISGQRTIGFRGPGYSLSPAVLEVLVDRGYAYDASTLPTPIGPLARQFYFRTAKLNAEQRAEREHLFGSWRDGLRPVQPYRWDVNGRPLLEMPVTVLPGARVPFHLSYVLYLAGRSEAAAVAYFRAGLRACRLARVEPSILLHPLDVVGADDVDALRFFPAMGLSGELKRRVVTRCLRALAVDFDVVTMSRHADVLRTRPSLRSVPHTKAAPASERNAA